MNDLFGNFGENGTIVQININPTNKKHTSKKENCVSSKHKVNTNALVLFKILLLVAIILVLLLVCLSIDDKTTEDFICIIKKIFDIFG